MNHLTYSSGQLSELDLIIIPILQMRKLRGREVKSPRSKAVNPSLWFQSLLFTAMLNASHSAHPSKKCEEKQRAGWDASTQGDTWSCSLKEELQGLLIDNQKIKGNCEPLALPEALGSRKTRITGPRGNCCFQAKPTPSCAVPGAAFPGDSLRDEDRQGAPVGKKESVFL